MPLKSVSLINSVKKGEVCAVKDKDGNWVYVPRVDDVDAAIAFQKDRSRLRMERYGTADQVKAGLMAHQTDGEATPDKSESPPPSKGD